MKPILLALLCSCTFVTARPVFAQQRFEIPTTATNTGGWQMQTTGITEGVLHAVSAVDGNVCWLAGDSGKIIRTVDGGNSWSLVNSGIIGIQNVDVFEGVSDSIAYAGTTLADTAYMYKTTDGGTSWSKVFSQDGGFVFAIKMFTTTKGIAVGDPIGGRWMILKTTNSGETWSRVPTEPLQIGGANGGTGFGAFDTSYVWFFDNTGRGYSSNDGGETWSYSSEPASGMSLIWWNNFYAPRLALSVTLAMVFRYDFFGWSTVGPPPMFLYPLGGLVGAIGTREFWLVQNAVYYTSNAGTSWTASTPHGLNTHVGLIDMVTLGSEVSAWATGIGDTIYHYQRLPTEVEEQPQTLPQEFALSQNYPNPFNPSTTIVYRVGSRESISLRVFNLLGQEVAALVNGSQEPGEHSVEWKPEGLSSGVYIYRLTTGKATIAKKMLLVR